MKPQACLPCAKRKVKCDREEPCSNCKRRKQDDCTYIETTPQDRIAQLENYVRKLGGDPQKTDSPPRVAVVSRERTNGNGIAKPPQKRARSSETPGGKYGDEPVLIKQNGASVYLESPVWFSEQGKLPSWKHHDGPVRAPVFAKGARALAYVLKDDPDLQITAGHSTAQRQARMWQIFYRNVHPITNLSFERDMERIRTTPVESLTDADHAFAFAIYLLSTTSLSDDECATEFHATRSSLLNGYQMCYEYALTRCNFLETSDLIVVQALVMYISYGMERFNAKSLWAFVGIVVRIAERIGLHRDGILLNLSPYETERRRRIWWHLQQLDLAIGVTSGSTSLSSNADWDTRIPLNIEDEDISPEDKESPKPREGITSKSYSLWMYWVFLEQRSFVRADGNRNGFGWVADPNIPAPDKIALLDRLEAGLNERLRYCDPIRAPDVLLQSAGRGLLCGLRRLILHVPVVSGQEESRKELFDVSIRCLEYDVVINSSKLIAPFKWRMKTFFPWSSLIHVLSEASAAQDGSPKATKIWDLLLEVYACNDDLWTLKEDQRKMHAAELIVSVWKVREKSAMGIERPPKPRIIAELERRILEAKRENATNEKNGESTEVETTTETPLSTALESDLGSFDPSSISELNFEEIDWSFWEGLDFGPT